MDTDTSTWPEYCLGYHTFRAPPELQLATRAAQVGMHEVTVHRTPVPVTDFILSQDDVHEAIVTQDVNGWIVIVASETAGLAVSSRTLVVYGAQRVGERIVLTRAGASRSRVENDGNDPRLWEFHAQTRAMDLTDRAGQPGFCHDSIFLATTAPIGEAEFFATLNGEGVARSDQSMTVLVLFGGTDGEASRPLALQTDIGTLPGIDVASESLTIAGRSFGVATTNFDDGNQSGHWYDASAFGQPNSTSEPLAISIKYQDTTLEPTQSRERLLGILSSIRTNE